MKIIIKLFTEFFSLGLFTYGGGLAILALLQEKVVELNWLTTQQFSDMIAIAQSTPGPIAINLATFVGYFQGGILGSAVATVSIVIPGASLSLIISKFVSKFNQKPVVKAVLRGLRAVVIGLIVYAVFGIMKVSIINVNLYMQTKKVLDLFEPIAIALFAVMMVLAVKLKKKSPFFLIIPAGIIGTILWH